MEFITDEPVIGININGTDDPYYRYKMPKLEITIISKKGGTTQVDNGLQVAESIYRTLPDLTSYYSKSMGARVKVENGMMMIPGIHEQQHLQTLLFKYINANVLCEKCGNPETLPYKKQKRKCQACGHIIS